MIYNNSWEKATFISNVSFPRCYVQLYIFSSYVQLYFFNSQIIGHAFEKSK